MLAHARRVGASCALVVGDMPFVSYHGSIEDAVRTRAASSRRRVPRREARGGTVAPAHARLVSAGIPVMGHIGLTPQSEPARRIQGPGPDGRDARSCSRCPGARRGRRLRHRARGRSDRSPRASPSAHRADDRHRRRPECDGQVLVFHDLLGLTEGRAPRFVKRYANLADEIRSALETYAEEVRGASTAGAHVRDA